MKQSVYRVFAFLGGWVCLGYELASGKLTEPFFGAGIEAWVCVLASILAGFAGGYFLSVVLSSRLTAEKHIAGLTFCTAAAVTLLLVAGDGWMEWLYLSLGYRSHILIQFIISFPPVFLLSASTPLLVKLESSRTGKAGKSSGNLLALSTLGGVAGLFVTGFWIIPSFGLEVWLGAHIILLVVMGLGWQMVAGRGRWLPIIINSLLLLAVCLRLGLAASVLPTDIVYRNTGLHGELIVTDMPVEKGDVTIQRRMILNNRIAQTAENPESRASLWDYPHFLSSVAGMKPPGAKALVLGMAGGTVVRELTDLQFQVEAVDLDPRMEKIAKQYFALPPQTKVITDDARHYVNTTANLYDLVVMDLFAAEGQPAHVFSVESFRRMHDILQPDGLLIANYHGFWEGDEGLGSRSVMRTLQEAGFVTYMVITPGAPVERNLLLIGSRVPLMPPSGINFRQNPCCNVRLGYIGNMILQIPAPRCADGIILRDDLPALDRLNKDAYRAWRNYSIDHYLIPLRKKGLPFY